MDVFLGHKSFNPFPHTTNLQQKTLKHKDKNMEMSLNGNMVFEKTNKRRGK